ncbi:MAG: phosphocholine cytidylyltransferase family protein [Deltaproteobacteria bacterium]|nr:phosphocholine cytidylyltransferase family protein [Deltaproteobacteria bacterium]
MRAIILAAGRGSRMKGLTEERPKCLVEFRGKALLEWQLAALRGAGLTEIAIVTGYRRELLADRGLTEFHNSRWAETNMVSSLECAGKWLLEEPCVVSYSDIFYHSSAPSSLMRSSAALAVTFDPNWRRLWEARFADPLTDAETFRLSAAGTVTEIGNRPKTIEEVQGQYMGLLRFAPEGWREVVRIRESLSKEVRDRMHMTGTLQLVIAQGRVPVAAVAYSDVWGEFDSLEDIEAHQSQKSIPEDHQ